MLDISSSMLTPQAEARLASDWPWIAARTDCWVLAWAAATPVAATTALHRMSGPVLDDDSWAIWSAIELSRLGVPVPVAAAAPTPRGFVTARDKVFAVVPAKKAPVGLPSRSCAVE